MVKGVILTLRKPTMLSSTVPDNVRTGSRQECFEDLDVNRMWLPDDLQ